MGSQVLQELRLSSFGDPIKEWKKSEYLGGYSQIFRHRFMNKNIDNLNRNYIKMHYVINITKTNITKQLN